MGFTIADIVKFSIYYSNTSNPFMDGFLAWFAFLFRRAVCHILLVLLTFIFSLIPYVSLIPCALIGVGIFFNIGY